jgi:hypothetical protein
MTKSQIISLLASNNRAVERALVALYHRQTVDEQRTSTTKESNGVGFNARDAEYATYLAKWVISGRHLTGRHLEAGRRIATFYARQLAEMSETRATPRPQRSPVGVLITGSDMSHLLRQHDRFQVFPGLTLGR